MYLILLKIIKCDFYKPWAGVNCIHAGLLLVGWTTPVPWVRFIDLTICKHDLNSTFLSRGEEDHIIIYQVIVNTHEYEAELKAKVLLT